MPAWPEEKRSILQAEGAIFPIHGDGVGGLLLHGEVHVELNVVSCFIEGPHFSQKPLKVFPMFWRYGEVKPTDPSVVTDILRSLNQVLLKGSTTLIRISMELKEPFGQIGVVEPPRGQEIIKDLREFPPFRQGLDVEALIGHEVPEGIEEGEVVDTDHEFEKVLAFSVSRLRSSRNLVPVQAGFMGVKPEEQLEHPGGGT